MPFSPSDFLRHKQLLPSELRTAEWDALSRQSAHGAAADAWIKERAFFMAGVAAVEQLRQFRRTAAAIAAGKISPQEARKQMRAWLNEHKYQPTPGLQGTVKDLSSTQRLKASLDTNVALARGWAQHATSMQNTARPALELYRAGHSNNPRDWAARWKEAAEAVAWQGVAKGGAMVALKTSPIWAALSRFGNPYPPFDYNSKMRVRSVPMERAKQLQLMPDDDAAVQQQAQLQRSQIPSLNENVAVPMDGLSRQLRQQAQDLFQGIAEWDRNSQAFLMTDMNGTKPYPWDAIGRIISAPNPVAGNLQLQAFQLWTKDSSKFRDVVRGTRVKGLSLDVVQDCARLFARIQPTASHEGGAVHRALAFSDERDFQDLVNRLTHIGKDENGQPLDAPYYTTRPGTIAESWNNNTKTTRDYADKKFNIILHCNKYRSRRRIDGIYPHATLLKQPQGGTLAQEGESVFLGNVKFRVVRKHQPSRINGVVTYEFDVEEA